MIKQARDIDEVVEEGKRSRSDYLSVMSSNLFLSIKNLHIRQVILDIFY